MITNDGCSYPCACRCPSCGTWNFPYECGRKVTWKPCRKCGTDIITAAEAPVLDQIKSHTL